MSIKITDKYSCCGCEACAQVCSHHAIRMQEDNEGFRYPVVHPDSCVQCGLCEKVCQYITSVDKQQTKQYAFGGHINNDIILNESTSGGAFSSIADYWCDNNYVIFGAESEGLIVFHSYITDKSQLGRFRRSKYSQSVIGTAYIDANRFLQEGKKVLFSGTPCQLAGLMAYLRGKHYDNLLLVEVVCEGVPSPLLIRKLNDKIGTKKNGRITQLDYRYKDVNRWDYEVMYISYSSFDNSRCGSIKCDRWFNGFWSIWLNHLVSRPSCYNCLYTTQDRVADLTLGDLWGVHLYCPDLYNSNKGASLMISNTPKGESVARAVLKTTFVGRELDLSQALRFQGPMRKSISENPLRNSCMADLQSDMDYDSILRKWAKPSSVRLLISKYVWGNNHQKVIWWKLKQALKKRKY